MELLRVVENSVIFTFTKKLAIAFLREIKRNLYLSTNISNLKTVIEKQG